MLDFSRVDKNGIKNVSFVCSQSVYVCFLIFCLKLMDQHYSKCCILHYFKIRPNLVNLSLLLGFSYYFCEGRELKILQFIRYWFKFSAQSWHKIAQIGLKSILSSLMGNVLIIFFFFWLKLESQDYSNFLQFSIQSFFFETKPAVIF